jgi:hypothetical protein
MAGILDKKIPSLLGILIIVAGISATTFLVKGNQIFQTNAGPGDEPENIEVTNVSDNSFTVVYTTDKSTIGNLSVGKSKESLNQSFLDDRDKENNKVNEYKTHFITVNNLTPSTNYYFKIISGNSNNSVINVKTGSLINNSAASNTPISGSVINTDGSIPSEAVVIAKVSDAQNISTYIKKGGIYNLSFDKLRTSDLNNLFEIDENTIVAMEIYSSGIKSQIILKGNSLSQIPPITLSNNYNFFEEKNESSKSANQENIKFPEFKSKIKPRPSSIPKITPTIPVNQ